jgi:tetratricopeptide (TPR) repeat protein
MESNLSRRYPMQRLLIALVCGSVLAWGGSALAQADAQAALQAAQTAFEAGNWIEARQSAAKAAETDVRNPEVFLLLGKAHYQLGELDEAMAAWQKTLALAPEEPFAVKMLEALRAQRLSVETRIELVEALISERLYAAARDEVDRLLAEKAIAKSHGARLLILKAEALFSGMRPAAAGQADLAEALRSLQRAAVLYPAEVDAVQLALQTGRAKLRSTEPAMAEGIAMLRKLIADQPKTEAAATAEYELLWYDLANSFSPTAVDAMAAWIDAHPQHPQARRARRDQLTRLLALPAAPLAADAALTPAHVQALALAVEYLNSVAGGADSPAVVNEILNRLAQVYLPAKAHAAAIAGAEMLLTAELAGAQRRAALLKLLEFKLAAARQPIEEQAAAGAIGMLPLADKLPDPLEDLLQQLAAFNREFPAEGAWAVQMQAAGEIASLAGKVHRPRQASGLKAPHAWAFGLLKPVIAPEAPAEVVQQAAEMVQVIARQYDAIEEMPAKLAGLALSQSVVNRVSPSHQATWHSALVQHANRLAALAAFELNEDAKSGKADAHAQVSPLHKNMLETIGKLLAVDKSLAAWALSTVRTATDTYSAHGHWAAADELLTTLAAMLPLPEKRQAELALVQGVWIAQVQKEHQRLIDTGLTAPEKLDPRLIKALQRLYELQEGLDPRGPEVAEIRGVVAMLAAHYKALEYYETAAAVIAVKGEKPVAVADEYALFEAILLEEEGARRAFGRQLDEYGGREKIAMTEPIEALLKKWTQFIVDRPTSALASQAVERVFGLGRLFEQHGAYVVAGDIYRGFATAVADVKELASAAPGAATTVDRATLAAATALHQHANRELSKAREAHRADVPPPAALSDEFDAALAAYIAFIEARPESPLASQAIGQIMAIALDYAKMDAWEAADAVYSRLMRSKVAIHRPERLELARGLCQLGRVMPEHAREMLTTLTTTGLRSPASPSAEALAANGGTAMQLRGGGGLVNRPVVTATLPGPGAYGSIAPGPPPPADAFRFAEAEPAARSDVELLAMIGRQQANRAAQVAQLRDESVVQHNVSQQPQAGQQQGMAQQADAPAVPLLSAAELTRLDKAMTAAYEIFQGIRKTYGTTPTAEQARGEIFIMAAHWRGLRQWQRAAAVAEQYLADNATDRQLPQLRLEIARDRLAWASHPIDRPLPRPVLLTEVASRFEAARAELRKVINAFPRERAIQQEAQWTLAESYLVEARAVAAISPTLARGQYVRAARELRSVAASHPTHPRLNAIPESLWGIAQELAGRGFDEEAIHVLSELLIYDPLHPYSQQALAQIAEGYRHKLKRPLKAAEAYQELNFVRGGNDQASQNAIFEIGNELKNEKRWVEALHVLETFADSFPQHPQAGLALTMVGQVHQTNEAWQDAIAAYKRVVAEYTEGQWVNDAKWAIAECTINLSQWDEAMRAYRDFVAAYPQDGKAAEANRRIEVLKDLVRYQGLVDEKGQRKSFDAQYQIAQIVRTQLANPVKAIIEYRKVVANWPDSHLADDALYEVGTSYLGLGETEKARKALQQVAAEYPSSPLADDALFMVGRSHEEEADRLSTVTRATQLEKAKETAQRSAYDQVQAGRRAQVSKQQDRVSSLKAMGKGGSAEVEEARNAFNFGQFNDASVMLFAQKAEQDVETLTATQLADRQDKINAALRKAVEAYTTASKVPGGDKAGDALLSMATIYDQRLKDSEAAMATWLEIVAQFSGTAVAEDASWKIAQYYEREKKFAEAIDAYNAFLRNYRRSPNAGAAQFAIAETYEHLGQWVQAMDSYSKYITNFADGPLVEKAKEQINWIKTYRL